MIKIQIKNKEELRLLVGITMLTVEEANRYGIKVGDIIASYWGFSRVVEIPKNPEGLCMLEKVAYADNLTVWTDECRAQTVLKRRGDC